MLSHARLALAVLASFAVSSLAGAATLTFELDYEFSMADAPVGPPPWVTITLDDSFGDANTVRVTVSAVGLTGGSSGESIKSISLNFDPVLDASLLVFTAVDTSASSASVTGLNDSYMADGDGFFDIFFDFPPPPGSSAARFTGGETVVYDMTYVSPITVASFDYLSVMGGGSGSYHAAAQILRIGVDADGSGWIGPGVPEPGTTWLLGLGFLGLAVARRR